MYNVGACAHVDLCRHAIARKAQFFMLEFFPPHTVEGARNLVARMDRLARMKPRPLSVDITWTLDNGKRSVAFMLALVLLMSNALLFDFIPFHMLTAPSHACAVFHRSFETLVAAQAVCALDVQARALFDSHPFCTCISGSYPHVLASVPCTEKNGASQSCQAGRWNLDGLNVLADGRCI